MIDDDARRATRALVALDVRPPTLLALLARTMHSSAQLPVLLSTAELAGREALRRFVVAMRASLPDLVTTLRWTAEGTHRGEHMGVASTGNRVRWSEANTLLRLQQIAVRSFPVAPPPTR